MIDAFEIEVIVLHFVAVFFIAFFPVIFSNNKLSSQQPRTYQQLTKRVSFAAVTQLYLFLWIVFYGFSIAASSMVRLQCGGYVKDHNAIPLLQFWLLQLIVAVYVALFARLHFFMSIIFLLAALIMCVVVAWQFNPCSPIATIFMLVNAFWLLYVMFVTLAVLRYNSTNTIQNGIARLASSSSTKQRTKPEIINA